MAPLGARQFGLRVILLGVRVRVPEFARRLVVTGRGMGDGGNVAATALDEIRHRPPDVVVGALHQQEVTAIV